MNNLNKEVLHLQLALRGNMDNNDVSHDEANLANNKLKPTTPLVPTLWKKRKDSFMIELSRMMSETNTITLQ